MFRFTGKRQELGNEDNYAGVVVGVRSVVEGLRCPRGPVHPPSTKVGSFRSAGKRTLGHGDGTTWCRGLRVRISDAGTGSVPTTLRATPGAGGRPRRDTFGVPDESGIGKRPPPSSGRTEVLRCHVVCDRSQKGLHCSPEPPGAGDGVRCEVGVPRGPRLTHGPEIWTHEYCRSLVVPQSTGTDLV